MHCDNAVLQPLILGDALLVSDQLTDHHHSRRAWGHFLINERHLLPQHPWLLLANCSSSARRNPFFEWIRKSRNPITLSSDPSPSSLFPMLLVVIPVQCWSISPPIMTPQHYSDHKADLCSGHYMDKFDFSSGKFSLIDSEPERYLWRTYLVPCDLLGQPYPPYWPRQVMKIPGTNGALTRASTNRWRWILSVFSLINRSSHYSDIESFRKKINGLLRPIMLMGFLSKHWRTLYFLKFQLCFHEGLIPWMRSHVRFCLVQGQEYTPQYMLEYQRLDEGRWLRYRGHDGNEVSLNIAPGIATHWDDHMWSPDCRVLFESRKNPRGGVVQSFHLKSDYQCG